MNEIYLYDDRFTLILNGSEESVTVDEITLDEIESYFESQEECSLLEMDAPPKGYYTSTYCFRGGFAVTVWL